MAFLSEKEKKKTAVRQAKRISSLCVSTGPEGLSTLSKAIVGRVDMYKARVAMRELVIAGQYRLPVQKAVHFGVSQ